MTMPEILALAAALSMDAFAVAVCTGCTLQTITSGHWLRMGSTFGFFQFAMPVAGWYLGLSVRTVVAAWDHWIAFILLAWIGGNMLREGMERPKGTRGGNGCDATRGRSLFLLAVATSIDALAVGFSFSMLHIAVWIPAISIGLVCAILTVLGLAIGHALGRATRLGQHMELFGGLVLIAIGIKILYEHGVFQFLS